METPDGWCYATARDGDATGYAMSRDARATRRARNLDASLDADAATPRAFDERASDRRDAYLDNLKYALMLIVVWNHALQEFLRALDAHERRGWCERDAVNATTHGHVRTLYLVLCATGMPLFAGASGYLSKSWLRAAREDEASAVNLLVRVRGAFGTLLGTYAVWQAFYVAINYYDVAPLQWWAPVGVMWYLLALFFWRMSVLVVGGLRNGVIVALSVFMGLFVGFTETATTKNGNAAFDWQRVFVYSVYFFLGCVALKPEHLQRLQSIDYGRRATFGAIVLAVAYALLYVVLNVFEECFDDVQWFIWSIAPYKSSSVAAQFIDMLKRIALYVFTAFAGLGVLALVPSKKSFITAMGSRTLYCYLTHILLVRGFSMLIDRVWPAAPLSFRLSAGALWLPLIVGNALMAQPVLFLKPVVEPDFSFLSRPRGAESVANVA
jgi:fucose 4-O-acetylase-like acetyltransferase